MTIQLSFTYIDCAFSLFQKPDSCFSFETRRQNLHIVLKIFFHLPFLGDFIGIYSKLPFLSASEQSLFSVNNKSVNINGNLMNNSSEINKILQFKQN